MRLRGRRFLLAVAMPFAVLATSLQAVVDLAAPDVAQAAVPGDPAAPDDPVTTAPIDGESVGVDLDALSKSGDFSKSAPPTPSEMAALDEAASRREAAKDKKGYVEGASQVVSRDGSSTTYVNPDGSYTREMAGGTVNYRDRGGVWRAMDASMKLDEKSGRLVAHDLPVEVSVGTDLAGPDTIALKGDSWSMGIGLGGGNGATRSAKDSLGVPGRAAVASEVRFSGSPDGDVVIASTPGAIEWSLELNKPAAGVWSYPLQLDGVTAKEVEDGVALYDATGAEVARIRNGVAWDASPSAADGAKATTPVKVSLLSASRSAPRLMVTVDRAWLNDTARVFPVTVDPAVGYVTPSTAVQDAFVSDAFPTTPGGEWDGDYYVTKAGATGTPTYKYKTYEKFDLGPVQGKPVTAASWWGVSINSTPATMTYSLWPLASSWNPATVSWNSQPAIVDAASIPANIAGMARTASGNGYWLVGSNGGVYSFGDAQFYGSAVGHTASSIVAMAARPQGDGYWILAQDGQVWKFPEDVSVQASGWTANAVSIEATPSGAGFWALADDGAIVTNGDAPFNGNGLNLSSSPFSAIGARPAGGYWLLAQDGGVFTFGSGTPFYGSFVGLSSQPLVSLEVRPQGDGYWAVASDGGVFSSSGIPFYGSTGGGSQPYPFKSITSNPAGNGYWVTSQGGLVIAFGSAPYLGGTAGGQSINASTSGAGAQWISADVTGWVANWASGVWANNGIMIDTGNRSGFGRIASQTQPGWEPRLSITYSDASPTLSNPAFPTSGQQVTTTQPVMTSSTATDNDGDAVQYWFRIATGTDAETGGVVNSGWISSPTWTPQANTLQDGGTYGCAHL